jgi:hypothetical protein
VLIDVSSSEFLKKELEVGKQDPQEIVLGSYESSMILSNQLE